MSFNKHAPEVRAIVELIERKMQAAMDQLCADSTEDKSLPKLRTRYATLKTLKNDIEEMINAPE